MGKLIIGLIIGLVVGAGGGWLLASNIAVKGTEEKLAQEKALNTENRDQLEKLQSEYDALMARNEADIAQVTDRLSEKDEQIAALEAEKEKIAPEMARLRAEKEELVKEVVEYKKKCDLLTAGPAEAEPEKPDEETKLIKAMLDRMKRVTSIGGPLNEVAVKELGLDENQVAGINEALKEEGERMHRRLAEWADELLKDKTAEELMKMTDLEISVAIMPHIQDELNVLRKLDPEEQKKINVEKHFIRYLPKDAKMTRIVRVLYEERRKTYENMAAYVNEEQEKAMKEKYFQPGTFVFPGGAGYGMGQLSAEDFEE